MQGADRSAILRGYDGRDSPTMWTRHALRRLIACGLMAAGVPLAAEDASTPVVYSADVDGIIHPVSAEYMIQTINRANQDDAALVVFTLRTPGGLVDSTRDIIAHMLDSKAPVAVFVGPAGGRAASAGFLITMAADVAAMAPGTHIGAAHPVAGNGQAMDETESKKAAEDVAAYVRTLTSHRHRNVTLAEQAVNESKAFTEQEALDANPPLIDLLATDVPDLLGKLDGRSITRFDGSTLVLHTAGARVVPIEMSLRQRVLSAIAHPEVAYILLTLGTLGLTIELWSPGAILPGVAGALCLLLAFFALQVLPFNMAGLLLMLLGLVLFALEIKITSYGLLTIGGLVSLTIGSMMLMDASVPELRLSLGFVLPVVLAFAGIAAFLVRLAIQSQRRRSVTGEEGMVGEVGKALTAIGPSEEGQVLTHGEIWRATAPDPIEPGARVAVVGVRGLTLTVRKE